MLKPLALVSVTDKSRIESFAHSLLELGFEILSTGGTAKLLREAGVSCMDAAEYTGSPEILNGRVKTLHPKIHGGILYDRQNPSHVAQAGDFSIRPIDLVVVNLYDFANKGQDLDLPKAIEFIDIGGPCMLRAAAKNYLSAAPVIDPADYDQIIEELRSGELSTSTRRRLAAKAFRKISEYDAMIASSFEESASPSGLELIKKSDLRYGENPHQKAIFYTSKESLSGGLQDAKILQGKELSYNNYLDIDAAANLVADFPEYQAVAIIKHTNPCGTAIATDEPLILTYQRALEADPKSAFGGIVAFNKEVDGETASALSETFLECIVAPKFSDQAIAVLSKKKNLRLLELPFLSKRELGPQFDLRSVTGGFLWQEKDQERTSEGEGKWKIVTKVTPDERSTEDLIFAQRVCKHVKSNAIVLARNGQTLAVGAGQMSRIDSLQFAAEKAKEFGRSLEGAVMASDAFFPFRDNIDFAAKIGIKAIIQPGGSVRDEECIAAADEHKISMAFSGIRHFKH